MSRRTERVASLIRDIVADAISHKLNDPRIEPLTSITRVEVSPDFSIARVNVSVMAPEARQKLCLAALQHAAGRMRSYVADGLSMRIVPRIMFHLDHSIQRGLETLRVIDTVMAESSPDATIDRSGEADEADSTDDAGEALARADDQ